ncbi:hypothetical protein [Saccharothrix variisporea]|uniref:Alpha/beta hydrolase family protein n=1 Tax=Saccharothrix variisporea TaxID=543527 RepID=A0A495X2L4_9PSEU|nr:hypothetical protein [Saccharothrix variisporea]RKT67424.1 hypothetical protein DFJ66_0599 [Saccharothrix variisporea]
MTWLALLLPGGGYTTAQPLFHYTDQLLRHLGATTRHLTYPSRDDPDVTAQLHDTADHDRVTLVGKSLGTAAMSRLLDHPLPARTDAVWLTPLFGRPEVRHAAATCPWRSLYVVGLADLYHHPDAHAGLPGHTLALPDADHRLDVPGDVHRSLAHLATVLAALDAFLRDPATPETLDG